MPKLQDGTEIIDPNHSAVAVGAGSTAVLSANEKRNYLLLINDSDEVLYLNFDGAAALNTGIRLNAAGASYEMTASDNIWQGAITAISTSGSKNLLVLEGESS